MQSTYSYEKMPFLVKSLKSSIANFENSDLIFNFFILRNDTNLSRLVLKNLYKSMNRNLTQFWESDFLVISLTYFVNKMYFSLVIGRDPVPESGHESDNFWLVRRLWQLPLQFKLR